MKPFERIFVINLPFKTDRLERLKALMPAILSDFEVWPAVHGDKILHPDNWTAGNGAWGCYRSHMQILEHCMQHGIESYLVLEDDALFADDFCEILSETIKQLPSDWCQLYLGGQLLKERKNPPKRINEFVYVPFNVNRTHCFALHSRGYQAIYKHLFQLPFFNKEHIDHHLGRLHETGKFPVYCTRRWIVGQNDGPSNIGPKPLKVPHFWNHAEKCAGKEHWLLESPLCVFLEAPPNVAKLLQSRGWHQGKRKNEDGLDNGVCDAMSSLDPEPKLADWYGWVQSEVVDDKLVVPCLWHPYLPWEMVSRMGFAEWVRVKADTEEECMQIMRECQNWKGRQDVFSK